MNNAPVSGAGAANNADNVDNGILADSGLCPYTPDCRRLTAEASAPETADCKLCGQTLSRAALTRMLEGGA